MSNTDLEHNAARAALHDEFLYQTQMQTATTLLLENAIAERLKINVIDLHCANLLRIMGPMTAGKLAEATGLTTGAITGMLDRLEKIGFVRREADPTDRRRVFAHAQKQAMDTAIGPLYESLLHASLDIVGGYSDEQLGFLLGHMRRSNALMLDETHRIRHARAQKDQAARFDHQDAVVTLPLNGIHAGHLILTEGALRVTLEAAPATHLLSAQFEKVIPGLSTDGGVVNVVYPRAAAGRAGGNATIQLNSAIPWRVDLTLASASCVADLSALPLRALDLKAVASTIEIMLPTPTDVVPLRLTGDASTVMVQCQPNTALQITRRRMAGHVQVNGETVEKGYMTDGYAEASGRYAIDVRARLTPVNIALP